VSSTDGRNDRTHRPPEGRERERGSGRPGGRRGPDIEIVISYILIAGVLTSLVLIVAGLGVYAAERRSIVPDYTLPRDNLYAFIAFTFRRLLEGRPTGESLMDLGIIVLMLTPFIRVLMSVFLFAFAERNRKYTLITLWVLAVLAYSLFLRG